MEDGDEGKGISRLRSEKPKPEDVKTEIGAGANADSSGEGFKFGAMDPLSELVWSPRNGLSLRCADFSFTRKTKLLSPTFGLGLSNMVIPQRSRSNDETSHHVNFQLRTRDMLDRTEAQVNQECRPSSEMDRPSSGTGGILEDVNTVVSLSAQQIVEKEEKDVEDSKEAEAGDGNSGRLLDIPRTIGGRRETSRVLDASNQDPGMMAGIESREGSAFIAEKENGDKMKRANRMNVSNVENLESTAENDLPTLACSASKTLLNDECHQDAEKARLLSCPPIDKGSGKCQAKGQGKEKEKEKEKAWSDGNIDGRTWKDIEGDESFGSVESCNSAGLFSNGKKRPNYEQQMIAGSKRHKMQIQEHQGSTSKLGHDSSFMNWISNMMKGFWKTNEEHSPAGALTVTTTNDQVNGIAHQHFALYCHNEDSECRNTGFQSFFQSIYFPRRRIQDTDEECDPLSCNGKFPNFENHVSSSGNEIGLMAEPNVSSGKVVCDPSNEAVSSENKILCNQESYSDKEGKGSPSSRSKSKWNEDRTIGSVPDGKEIQTFTNRNGALRNLWISRFSSRNSCLQTNVSRDRTDLKVQEANESASHMARTLDSRKTPEEDCAADSVSAINACGESNLMHNLNPVVSSPRIESSEALASLFARRLGAIKHIMASDLAENVEGSTIITCFYCGKDDHHLRDCSEVTDNELGDLMWSVNAHNKSEIASGLCIRCFQLNHWAASCPNAPRRNSKAKGKKSSADMLGSTSAAEFSLQDVPKTIFDAVQVLRLSRSDILKWMNSKTSVSNLEGFFLRLRLGKWEEGLGGTGYYVACITGTVEEQSSTGRSKNSISVEVGGTTCLVEPQYISNHDFLEEELKAWWRATAKSDGGIPSEEELSRKIRQRKILGL